MVLWFVGISSDTMWNFTQEIILSRWFVWIIYKEICLYRKGDYESVHWIRMESCRLTHDFYKLIFLSILLRCYLICFLTRDVCGLIYGVVILDIEIIKARVFCWLLISIHWRSVKKKIDISLRYRKVLVHWGFIVFIFIPDQNINFKSTNKSDIEATYHFSFW